MPTPPDRRAFLAAGALAAGGPLFGQPLPPGKKDPPADPKAGLALLTLDDGPKVPAGARRLGTTHFRVPNGMNAFRLAPDGRTVVAAVSDEIRGWELATGKVVFRHKYPEGVSVSAGRVTDGSTLTLLVTHDSGNKAEFRRYVLGTGKLISRSATVNGTSFDHTAFSRDGKHAALVQRESLAMYDVATGRELWQEPIPPESMGGLAITPDGTRLVVAAKEEMRVVEIGSRKVARTHRIGEAGKGELNPGRGRSRLAEPVVSPAGDWIACPAGEDDSEVVLVWGATDKVPRYTFKAEKPIAFTGDQKQLVTYQKGRVTFHDLAAGKALRQVDVVTDDDLVLTPDGKVFVASAADAIVVTDADTGQLLPHSADPPGLPQDLRFAGNRLIGMLSEWRGWVEWDMATGRHRLIRPPAVHGSYPVELSADQRVTLFQRGTMAEVRDASTGKVLHEVAATLDSRGLLTADGKTVVARTNSGFTVLDVGTGHIRNLSGPAGPGGPNAERMIGSPDGRVVAVTTADRDEAGAVAVYDIAAGRFIRRIGLGGAVRGARLSRTGRLVVVAHDAEGGRFGRRSALTVFDVATGRPVFKTSSDDPSEPVLAFSDDDRHLAHVESKQIALWEVLSSQVRTRFPVPGSVQSLAFSPDGRTVAASGSGGPVLLWPIFANKNEGPPTAADLDADWAALAGNRADEAFEAVRRLAAHPAQSLPFLKRKIEPVRAPEPARLEKLIFNLDHREFRKREAAMRELTDLGEKCRGALEKALATEAAPERRERLEKLLAIDDSITPATLIRCRAVEAVEHADSPAAADVLAYWAAGAEGASLTREAAGALKRVRAGMK